MSAPETADGAPDHAKAPETTDGAPDHTSAPEATDGGPDHTNAPEPADLGTPRMSAPDGGVSGRRRFRFPTALLLTCAALGVAGGLLLAPANWVSTILFPGLPFVSVALAGLWLLPSVIALRLLRAPLVGLLVGLLAGLVIVPFSGYGFGSVATNLWWAAFTELPFLFVMWRYWGTWLHYVGAVVVGSCIPCSRGRRSTWAVSPFRCSCSSSRSHSRAVSPPPPSAS